MFTDLRPCPPGCAPGGIPPGGRLHLVYLMPRVELTDRSPWAEPSVLSSPLAVTTRAVDQTDQQILNIKNLKSGIRNARKVLFPGIQSAAHPGGPGARCKQNFA